jgi:hypothetical protein
MICNCNWTEAAASFSLSGAAERHARSHSTEARSGWNAWKLQTKGLCLFRQASGVACFQRRVSAQDHQRTRLPRNPTSALPPKADSSRPSHHVRFVPSADIVPLYSTTSSARVSSVEGGCSRTKVILFDQWITPRAAGLAPRAVRASDQRDGFGGGSQLLPISSLACETTFR